MEKNHDPVTVTSRNTVWDWIVSDIGLGHGLTILTMFAALGTGVYQGGAIRAQLADSIAAETALRVSEMAHFEQNLVNVQGDIRDLRTLVFEYHAERMGKQP